jgi:DNA-binding transcriptional ArsR family regulator
MVNDSDATLDLVFHALSDSTRRSMLAQLVRKERSVSELAKPYRMSLAGVSKHLKVLEEARVVEKIREGRTFRCRANLKPLDEVSELLEELGMFWRAQLDSLEAFLQNNDVQSKEEQCREKKKTTRRRKS